MRVFKWTIDFHVDREASLAPVWFALPKLPIHLFQKQFLFPIVECLGRPLCVDAATARGSRPSVARVCIEVDLQRVLPSRIWISFGERMGFWQHLMPEGLPKYCSHCFHQGHAIEECKIKNPTLRTDAIHGGRRKRNQVYQSRGPLEVGTADGAPMERSTEVATMRGVSDIAGEAPGEGAGVTALAGNNTDALEELHQQLGPVGGHQGDSSKWVEGGAGDNPNKGPGGGERVARGLRC
ncbi:uncharacterized protein [Coffea arabica]|uniref:DUF4283 domain-containing protein n=1 Tax=Coffea arabica TaxID=13443 RepID=A0A6P6S3U5_COFAR|nr:uncharacterized protein LOC113687422 [Coffea arabica]